jgi:hypothetical protein
MERAGRLVFGADGIAAVVADAKPVTGQSEFGRLWEVAGFLLPRDLAIGDIFQILED